MHKSASDLRNSINNAMGGCIALQEAGLSIPEDISVMGYDGIP